MPALPTDLRRVLERTVIAAREASEKGANASLDALAVRDERLLAGLTPEQREHRNALRVRARALGGGDHDRGFHLLVEEVAYEQWHQMLFARFLAENDLLIHPTIGVAVSLEDCAELAADEGERDKWTTAAKYAGAMLPGIFRRDDPSVRVRLATNDLQALEELLDALPVVLFQSDDALGWVYQFWQTRAKQEVSASQRKVGGNDLAPVTQLFTEDYMVRFLLENSLAAWWAVRHPDSPLLTDWEYLRLREDGAPAAGAFPGWPATAREVTVMDPCCGSGHFLVAAARMLRAMRMEEEGLTAAEAAVAVLRENLFGLELDPRCTQIAAFALVFDAWKAGLRPPAAGGTSVVPHVACSGISVGGQLIEWTRLAGDDVNLRMTLERLYELFKDAPDLGSLINPSYLSARDHMFLRDYTEVAPLVEEALAKGGHDPAAAVFGADAEGVARAGALLARTYTLVVTNPPYLSRGKQDETLRSFADAAHKEAKADLATMFIERCRAFTANGGAYAMVTPQNWLFLGGYKKLRERFLREQTWCYVARLGEGGFESSAAAGAFTVLLILEERRSESGHTITGVDAAAPKASAGKASLLRQGPLAVFEQAAQLRNPDARLVLEPLGSNEALAILADGLAGVQTGDYPHYGRCFWELGTIGLRWEYQQSTVDATRSFGGREHLILWEEGSGAMYLEVAAKLGASGVKAWFRGTDLGGRRGVAVSSMRELSVSLYEGNLFDNNTAVIIPHERRHLPAIWAFCSSPEFNTAVRRIDQKLNVTNSTLVKVPFDLDYWQEEADRLYPAGLPEPHSDNPTQWLFRGQIVGSDAPLQVSVARLLGYRWPEQQAEGDPGIEPLDALVDTDGIVCLPPVAGEDGAAERLRLLLVEAYRHPPSGMRPRGSPPWPALPPSPNDWIAQLLAQAGSQGKSLEEWLREDFFAQHLKLFQQRPFVLHIWDGLKDGFGAVVNYHQLDHQRLEKLIYVYLNWWIEEQRKGIEAKETGAEQRYTAAVALKQKLEFVLEGEEPYDIFVRWKEPHQQAIGWESDLDDGVRMNIRPFMTADILRRRPNIKWGKDRGKNPDGTDRINDIHLSIALKRAARAARSAE